MGKGHLHMDSRRDERVPIGLPIRLRIRDIESFTEEYTTDLSAGGIFIEMEDPPQVGERVHLEFYLEAVGKSIWATGEVARCNPEVGEDGSAMGAGVEFVDLGEDGRKFIQLVVDRYRRRHPERAQDLPGDLRQTLTDRIQQARARQFERGDDLEIRLRAESARAFREENYEALWNREIFIETENPWPVGSKVRLKVYLEEESRWVWTECEVMRQESMPDLEYRSVRRGMALAFPSLSLPLQELLLIQN